MHIRHGLTLVGAALALSVLPMVVGAPAQAAPPPPWMYDESSYDVLTYSAWGRQNNVSGAICTGRGRAGKGVEGTTHNSYRCEVHVDGTPGGVVVAKVLGPESLRVLSVAGGKLKPDRGIGLVPQGRPTLQAWEAVAALQKGSWGKRHRISRALCYGLGQYRDTGFSQFFFAFSCATFDRRDQRGAQVLVTAAGKRSVRVVRTLSP